LNSVPLFPDSVFLLPTYLCLLMSCPLLMSHSPVDCLCFVRLVCFDGLLRLSLSSSPVFPRLFSSLLSVSCRRSVCRGPASPVARCSFIRRCCPRASARSFYRNF
jgi:hypothetical protein